MELKLVLGSRYAETSPVTSTQETNLDKVSPFLFEAENHCLFHICKHKLKVETL